MFLIGLALAACGLAVLHSHASFAWLLPVQTDALKHEVASTNDALLAGGLLMLVGALLAALSASRALPDLLGDRPLPTLALRPGSFRMLPLVGALVAATLCTALLYVHLVGKTYSHWDILLFLASLALAGFAVYSLSARPAVPASPPFRPLDAVLAFVLAVEAIAFGSFDLTSWKFGWVGDEGSFFGLARDIASGKPWDFFELRGVYDVHPVLDSALQAVGMKLVAPDVTGWRVSELLVLALCAALVYLLGTTLFGRWAGLAAGVVLGSSHYLLAFSRIGYNNTHMLLYTTLAMLMLALAWRTGQTVFLFAFGIALGACLYTFLGALLIWPIAVLVVLIVFVRRPDLRWIPALAVTLLGFALTTIPALLTTPLSHVIETAAQNVTSQAPGIDRLTLARQNFDISATIFWDNDRVGGHFVSGPIVDWVTGLLLIVGLAVAARRLDRRAERMVFIWFVLGLVLEAASNYTPVPQLTRELFVLPAAALLAGVAAAKFEAVLHGRLKLPWALASAPILIVLVSIPPLNLYQLLVTTPEQAGANPQMMVMKTLREHPNQLIVEVGPRPLPSGDVAIMLRAYPDLLDHYRYIGLADLQAGYSLRQGNNPPLYLVQDADKSILPIVRRVIPDSYTLSTDSDPGGHTVTHLLLPPDSASAGAPPAPPDSLVSVLEVQVQPLPGGKPPAPLDVAADNHGSLFVAGTGDGVIRKYDAQGHLLATWGNTRPGAPLFRSLAGLAISSEDILYALDSGAGTIQAFDLSGQPLGAPVTGLDAHGHAHAISITPQDDILVAGTAGGRLLRFRPNGSVGVGVGQEGQCNMSFNEPADALVSGLDDLFVLDRESRLTHVSWWFCQVQDAAFRQEWPLGVGNMPTPRRIALDAYGHLYVPAPATHEIVAYDSTGTELRHWPSPNNESPVGVYIDAQDTLFVTYADSALVRAYQLGP